MTASNVHISIPELSYCDASNSLYAVVLLCLITRIDTEGHMCPMDYYSKNTHHQKPHMTLRLSQHK